MHSSNRIPAIDALRALAVISVICYHMDSTLLPGGFAGVDIFFVISGYVVTRALSQRIDVSWLSYLKDFYVRRILRIFPALLVCLLGTLVIEALFVPKSWLSSQNFDTAKWAFFGLSNIFLSANEESYFSPRVEFNPYVHTWSLGVEEQFYVLLPLLYFAQRRFAVKGLGSAPKYALAALCAVSLCISFYYSLSKPSLAYYSLVSRFWELGLGALLFELHRVRGTHPLEKSTTAVLLGGSWVLLALGLLFSDKRYFPVPYAVLSVVGTLGLIDLAARRAWTMGTMGAAKLVVYIGTISYSLYLWHWPIFTFARWTIGLTDWPIKFAALGVILLLAMVSFHWVERPFQNSWFYKQRRLAVIIVGICAIFSGALMAKGVDKIRSKVTLSVTGDQQTWYPYDWTSSSKATGCHSVSRTEQHGTYQVVSIARQGCGEEKPSKTLFVAGDSHAGAYLTMLGRLALERPYLVKVYLMPGCGFFKLDDRLGSGTTECLNFVKNTTEEIFENSAKGDILFLPSLRLQRFGDQWGDVSAPGTPESISEAKRKTVIAATITGLDPILNKGISVIFEAPKPLFQAPSFRCSDWFNSGNPVCAGGLTVQKELLLSHRRPVMEIMSALQSQRIGIKIFDPFFTLCPSDPCEAVDRGTPLFFDGDHLSGAGNERLFASFDRFISGQTN